MRTKEEIRAYTRAWYQKNREKIMAERRKKRQENPHYDKELRVKDRLNREHKLAIKAGHPRPSVCNVCEATGKIFFDHNHRTGEFRGWICHNCNVILGLAKDNKRVLLALIKYLEETGSTPIDGTFVPISVQALLKR